MQESLDEKMKNDDRALNEDAPPPGDDPLVGKRVGAFKLTKELGRGAMGAVYLAERVDGEFRQLAAVKLIKRGMDTDFVVRRFRHERQILAALEHPNVARLIDGGTTADGLPYFVMEFVDGQPLYKFCDERELNIADRLRLFRGICDAVQAAHQHRIIHRDLKPSSILVKPNGKPKLLDFGIAKLLDATLSTATDFDWEQAEKYNRRALKLNPNSLVANQWMKTLLLQPGRFEAALKQANRLLELAPDSMLAIHFLAWTHHNLRRFAESISIHRQIVKNEPHYAFGRLSFSWTLRCAGEFEEAVAQARKGVELAPENPMYLTALAAALAENAQRDEALETLEKIHGMSATRYVSPYMLAIAYCGLKDKDGAFRQLEKGLAIRDVWLVWVGVEPQFDVLRDDRRYQDLLRRIGHPLALK